MIIRICVITILNTSNSVKNHKKIKGVVMKLKYSFASFMVFL